MWFHFYCEEGCFAQFSVRAETLSWWMMLGGYHWAYLACPTNRTAQQNPSCNQELRYKTGPQPIQKHKFSNHWHQRTPPGNHTSIQSIYVWAEYSKTPGSVSQVEWLVNASGAVLSNHPIPRVTQTSRASAAHSLSSELPCIKDAAWINNVPIAGPPYF